ncbi:MAG: SAM-dependent methyltransferase [Alcanivorax sp.]|jgi:SAM-dependent methyltransferase
MTQLPYSQASENNKKPLLKVLERVFADRKSVLEIGSGTGQHATYLAAALQHLSWQPTDIAAHLPILLPRCQQAATPNLASPLALDVCLKPWPDLLFDAVFTANTLHIMSSDSVRALFDSLGDFAHRDVCLAVYGPFNYGGQYSSESNALFDQWLVERDQASAIRDFEQVDALAQSAGFMLQEDNEMPANNRLLVWRRWG